MMTELMTDKNGLILEIPFPKVASLGNSLLGGGAAQRGVKRIGWATCLSRWCIALIERFPEGGSKGPDKRRFQERVRPLAQRNPGLRAGAALVA